MSGHSKWATIKRKKAATDSKRGKEFTKLIKEITVAAKSGGDPAGNPRLRLLLEKAKEINMPQENSMRAIKRGTGELPGMVYEASMYEGYGPHNVAVIVDALTDNKNRTVADVRRLFTNSGGSLGESGSVNWMFERLGVIHAIDKTNKTEDDLLEALIDFDMHDISKDEDYFTLTCDSKELEKVRQAVLALGLKIESAEIEWVPKNLTKLKGEQAEKAQEFLSELEDLDDVQNVYTTLEIED